MCESRDASAIFNYIRAIICESREIIFEFASALNERERMGSVISITEIEPYRDVYFGMICIVHIRGAKLSNFVVYIINAAALSTLQGSESTRLKNEHKVTIVF